MVLSVPMELMELKTLKQLDGKIFCDARLPNTVESTAKKNQSSKKRCNQARKKKGDPAKKKEQGTIYVPSHPRTLPVREHFVPFANILSRSRTGSNRQTCERT